MKLLLESWQQFLLEKRGKFVHGFKGQDYPDFDFDDFYNKLKAANLFHLLGKRGGDYKFGRAHAKALKALKATETGQTAQPEGKPNTAATKLSPPAPTTKTKEKPQATIATQKPASGAGNMLRGKSPSNQNRRYTAYIAPWTDLNSPVTVALYFSGMGGSPHYGKVQRLAKRAPQGTILIVPSLTGKPQRSSINVGSNFVQDVLRQISGGVQVGKINYFGHSAGGAAMARHINSLSDHSIIGSITLLDATYGWNAVKRMMKNVNPNLIKIITKEGSRTASHAKRYARSGVNNVIFTKTGHNRIGFKIG